MALTACSGGGASGSGRRPPAPPTFDVNMREYRFEHAPAVVAGRVVFRLRNAGSSTHELVLVALPENFPPIDEQLRSDERQGVDTVVAIHDRPPGNRTTFASDLQRGRYAFICFVADPDGVSHALKGMSSEFRVQ